MLTSSTVLDIQNQGPFRQSISSSPQLHITSIFIMPINQIPDKPINPTSPPTRTIATAGRVSFMPAEELFKAPVLASIAPLAEGRLLALVGAEKEVPETETVLVPATESEEAEVVKMVVLIPETERVLVPEYSPEEAEVVKLVVLISETETEPVPQAPLEV